MLTGLKIKKLEDENGNLQEQVDFLQTRLNTGGAEYSELSGKYRNLSEGFREKVKEGRSLKEKLQKYQDSDTTIADFEVKITQLNEVIEAQKDTITELQMDKDELTTQQAYSNLQNDMQEKDYESKISRITEELDYYKKLVETYQTMPDMKLMMENISTLKVPDVSQILELVKSTESISNANLDAIKSTVRDEIGKGIEYMTMSGRFR